MEATVYKKVCKHCGKEFESVARNTRYCSQECCDKAQKVRTSHNKKCAKRRKEYDENKDLARLVSRTYAIANALGALIPKVCALSGQPGHECSGPMELHHKNGNPFNNSLSNLEWRCRCAHEEAHKEMPVYSIVDILKEALLQENPQEVFREYFYDK